MNNDNIFRMCVFNLNGCPKSVYGLEVLGVVGVQLV